ncbi:MAG: hypothetical protein IRZ08_03270 [Frankia sp.]|nr:hypothetical protein [Frankia sp.]
MATIRQHPRGRTAEAGAGASDEEMVRQVARQTASDRAVEPFFEREHDGTLTDVEAAKARADQLVAPKRSR